MLNLRFLFRYAIIFTALTVTAHAKAEVTTMADSLPDRWQYVSEYIQSLPSDDRWWNNLNDPLLDSLITLGIDRNFNLQAAIHRIGAARQAINQAKAQYYPQISVSGGWTKSRNSGNMTGRNTPAETIDYFSLGAAASWEVDLFGRITAQVKQKKALYNASRADTGG